MGKSERGESGSGLGELAQGKRTRATSVYVGGWNQTKRLAGEEEALESEPMGSE